MAKIKLMHIGIKLIIEMAKIELTGGHIGMNWKANTKYRDGQNRELTGGHIGFMLIIEITKLELTGGHIGLY